MKLQYGRLYEMFNGATCAVIDDPYIRENENKIYKACYFNRNGGKTGINALFGIFYYENGTIYENQDNFNELNSGNNIKKEVFW